jgi:hypothetical protein
MMLSPTIWLLLLALLGGSGGFGYWAGDHNRNNAWLAKQAVQERANHAAFEAEVKRSNTAAVQAIADQADLQKSYSTLEGKFNELISRTPLVVYRAAAAVAVVGAIGAGGGTPVAAAGHAVKADGAEFDLAGAARNGAAVADAGLGLSLGAVWVWNSALTGSDAPAGACGAADTASPACAFDSGLGLADAWQNHITNAKSCATDRLRHQQLIDYLSAH